MASRLLLLSPLILLLLISASRSTSDSNPTNGFCSVEDDAELSSSSGRILIKQGTVVNAHHMEVADVYIEDGIIVSVRPNIVVGDDVKVIDAAGKYVMPGGIDPHAHLEMDFMGTVTIDDFYTGQAAALAGGTTMHIDFVNPSNGTLSSGFASYKVKAEKSVMDYGFHMVITKWDDAISEEMELMVKENGINSFKFFMAYKGSVMINDELLLQGLEKCKSLGALAMVHAENGDGVVVGQRRMIDLGITGPEGHALSRPPVLVGTDHCTFNSTQKSLGYGDFRKIPNGVNGIEERMHLIWDTMVESGKITASDYVRITSTECAKIFNIYPRKGAILEGSDADVIVLNPNASFRISAISHHSRSDTNVYEGRTGKGKVEVTISGGRVVWEDENLKVTAGSGKYIKMPPFGYLFNGIDQADARYLASLNAHVLR
ncbi:hypothetical protein KSP40_PGU009878 [Platanthera guangdongensis]|uniref:dihydropyrimidinase n=1 Tax=Platanthera guangdongensis TaxID=2320717 RepID=A0ABR2LUF9_9ASPA